MSGIKKLQAAVDPWMYAYARTRDGLNFSGLVREAIRADLKGHMDESIREEFEAAVTRVEESESMELQTLAGEAESLDEFIEKSKRTEATT
jgi:post-segregation antitoxin (ccd killing protein)